MDDRPHGHSGHWKHWLLAIAMVLTIVAAVVTVEPYISAFFNELAAS